MAKKRGRPTKKPEDSQGDYFQLRLSAADKELFRKAAKEAGVSLAQWMRDQCRAAIQRGKRKKSQ